MEFKPEELEFLRERVKSAFAVSHKSDGKKHYVSFNEKSIDNLFLNALRSDLSNQFGADQALSVSTLLTFFYNIENNKFHSKTIEQLKIYCIQIEETQVEISDNKESLYSRVILFVKKNSKNISIPYIKTLNDERKKVLIGLIFILGVGICFTSIFKIFKNKKTPPPQSSPVEIIQELSDSAKLFRDTIHYFESKYLVLFDENPLNDDTYEIPKKYQGFWRINSCNNVKDGYINIYPYSVAEVEFNSGNLKLKCYAAESITTLTNEKIRLGIYLKEVLFASETEAQYKWDEFALNAEIMDVGIIPGDSNRLLVKWYGFYNQTTGNYPLGYEHTEFPSWFNYQSLEDTLVRCETPVEYL